MLLEWVTWLWELRPLAKETGQPSLPSQSYRDWTVVWGITCSIHEYLSWLCKWQSVSEQFGAIHLDPAQGVCKGALAEAPWGSFWLSTLTSF